LRREEERLRQEEERLRREKGILGREDRRLRRKERRLEEETTRRRQQEGGQVGNAGRQEQQPRRIRATQADVIAAIVGNTAGARADDEEDELPNTGRLYDVGLNPEEVKRYRTVATSSSTNQIKRKNWKKLLWY
jgi:hypothetical protein